MYTYSQVGFDGYNGCLSRDALAFPPLQPDNFSMNGKILSSPQESFSLCRRVSLVAAVGLFVFFWGGRDRSGTSILAAFGKTWPTRRRMSS